MKSRLLIARFIRKTAALIGYKVDFAPRSIADGREKKAAYLSRLCARTAMLEGDIVECGLGHGFSFAYLAEQAQQAGKKLYGFDSFEGFPTPTPEDRSAYAVQAGDWANVTHVEIVDRILARVSREFLDANIRIVPGFFSDSLPKAPVDKIAFLHLDGDLYKSYMDCFEALYEKVVPGGIIALDEFLNGFEYVKYPGGFKAVVTFMEGKDVDICRDAETGKYYILKR